LEFPVKIQRGQFSCGLNQKRLFPTKIGVNLFFLLVRPIFQMILGRCQLEVSHANQIEVSHIYLLERPKGIKYENFVPVGQLKSWLKEGKI
jgi:hypothetical protein